MLRILAAALCCLIATAAIAEEDHGPPPSVGTVTIPTPRMVCFKPDALADIFASASDLAGLRMKAADHPECALIKFTLPLTIADTERVGSFVLPDGSEFTAWSLHGKFPDGDEVWMLWLELLEGKGA